MKKEFILKAISLAFVFLFVYAASAKLMELSKFRAQLGQSPMLSMYASFLAWIVPALELFIAILLTVPRFRLVALYASFGLMVLFTAYILVILNFSPYVPCSCGGILESLGWEEHIVFNAFFIALAAAGVVVSATGSKSGVIRQVS